MTCTTYGFLLIISPARELVNGTRSLYIVNQSSRIPLYSTHSFGLFGQRKDVLMIAVFVWLSFVRLGSKRSGQQILMVANQTSRWLQSLNTETFGIPTLPVVLSTKGL